MTAADGTGRTASTSTGVRLSLVEGEGALSALRLACYAAGALLGLASWLIVGVVALAVALLGLLG